MLVHTKITYNPDPRGPEIHSPLGRNGHPMCRRYMGCCFSFAASLPTEEIAEMLAVTRSKVSLMDYLLEEIQRDGCSVKISDFSEGKAVSATLLYRIAAFVFVLGALGHTYGFLNLRAPSAEGRAVYESMNAVHFELKGRNYSYGGVYRGLGLSCTMSMLFSAFLCWYLAELLRSAPGVIGALGWVFFVVQLAGVVLSFLYFGPPAIVLSVLFAACWVGRMSRAAMIRQNRSVGRKPKPPEVSTPRNMSRSFSRAALRWQGTYQ